ncbi:ABC transporter ATP-binding protein [Patescibacteria group bacterium]|nr:ABC transporter ATP-binding protein [Patescibacteria group bacterium]MBU1472711.1 ABC transporter ATP-binding protein [Patescibacteria group bacterium]MBU2459978.1 ABC transporter ATP-binding protein [Patescibacteria group bacterium]MBU2544364.1 ABC transporter ATP-binding protein [Patescibacteria group bacterium]
MRPDLLRVVGVSKEYRMDGVAFHALTNISFAIKKGEFVAIMGPSGSGKSTLMHIIGCLDRPSNGKAYFEGRDVFAANDRELASIRNIHIGFVFQQFNLLRRTSAIANVELPLVYANVSSNERHKKAKNILEQVGLGDKTENFPSQLSGGEQQRVAIARALVTNPSIILADEPTGNLDSKSGADIIKILKRLHEEGRTIVLVTHDEHVASHARRIISIADGVIVGDKKQ